MWHKEIFPRAVVRRDYFSGYIMRMRCINSMRIRYHHALPVSTYVKLFLKRFQFLVQAVISSAFFLIIKTLTYDRLSFLPSCFCHISLLRSIFTTGLAIFRLAVSTYFNDGNCQFPEGKLLVSHVETISSFRLNYYGTACKTAYYDYITAFEPLIFDESDRI